MANTYTLIASSTVGSGGAANIEFTSIPATYTDLLVKTSLRGASGGTDIKIQFNGSTASVYSYVRLYGTGSAINTTGTTTTNLINNMVAQSSYTANTFGNGEIYIPNYTSAAAKSVSIDGVTENNATGSFQTLTVGLWNPAAQAAITSIKLEIDGGGDFAQYSTAYLYGIKNS
jgi:hypothetical protein